MSQPPSIHALVADALFDGGYAIWRAENGVVEVYDEEGKLLKTVTIETKPIQAQWCVRFVSCRA